MTKGAQYSLHYVFSIPLIVGHFVFLMKVALGAWPRTGCEREAESRRTVTDGRAQPCAVNEEVYL